MSLLPYPPFYVELTRPLPGLFPLKHIVIDMRLPRGPIGAD